MFYHELAFGFSLAHTFHRWAGGSRMRGWKPFAYRLCEADVRYLQTILIERVAFTDPMA